MKVPTDSWLFISSLVRVRGKAIIRRTVGVSWVATQSPPEGGTLMARQGMANMYADIGEMLRTESLVVVASSILCVAVE